MAPNQKNADLTLALRNCHRWRDSEDLLEGLKLATSVGHLLPLKRRRVPVNHEVYRYANPVEADIETWFWKGFTEQVTGKPTSLDFFEYQTMLTGYLRTTLETEWEHAEIAPDAIKLLVDCRHFGERYNEVTLHSLFPSLYRDQVATLMAQIAYPLNEYWQPDYMAIGRVPTHIPLGGKVLQTEFTYIHWTNYFGPAYLNRYGRTIFETAPGSETKEIGQGLWYQLAESYSALEANEELQEAVRQHFSPIGVQVSV